MKLTPKQEYNLLVAREYLSLAEELESAKRRAKGQEMLREAQALFFQLPREFTDEEFSNKYTTLYNKLYRGF